MTISIPLHVLMSQGRAADFPVCFTADEIVTWQAFSDRVVMLMHGLKLRSESRWLLTTSDTLDFTIQLLALLHAGKHVLIPPNRQPGTLEQLAGEFDAIVSNDVASFDNSPRVLPTLDPHVANIELYTSGSTGTPKKVVKTLAQFEAEVAVLEGLWGCFLCERAVVATVPHYHIYGLIFRILWPLSSGRIFDTLTCADPVMLKERLSIFKKNILVSSPAQLSRLPELAVLTTLISPTEFIFSSGGPLSIKTATEFHRQLGHDPIEIFGSTETGGVAWRRQCVDDSWETLPGVIVGRDDNGELRLNSPFLDNTSSFRMTDAIDLLPDGKFHLLGRTDRIVKVEEKRLSLSEMESLLATHPWVGASIATPLSGRRQSVGVVVELSKDGWQQLLHHGRRYVSEHLRLHLNKHYEVVLLPRHWRFFEKLPFNTQEKLTLMAVASLFESKEHSYVET